MCRAHPDGGVPDCPGELGPPGPRRWSSLRLRAVSEATAPEALSRASIPPETFARVASGVVFLQFSDCEGGAEVPGFAVGGGTGFLVGSQVVMTARHAVTAGTLRGCRIHARLNDGWYDVTEAKAWYTSQSTAQDVDLATLKLTRAAPGHIFRFAQALPRRGDPVATIGHPLGLPLNFQQGLFRRAVDFRGSSSVVAQLSFENGNSGGPIINSSGDVISVISRAALEEDSVEEASFAGGLDLAQWFGASANRDLCRAYPRSGIPDCPADLTRAGERRWLPLELSTR